MDTDRNRLLNREVYGEWTDYAVSIAELSALLPGMIDVLSEVTKAESYAIQEQSIWTMVTRLMSSLNTMVTQMAVAKPGDTPRVITAELRRRP